MPTASSVDYSATRCDPLRNAEVAMENIISVKLAASTTFAAGTVLGKITATSLYTAYASGNADGSQIPVGILQYGAVTDGSSNITNAAEWPGVVRGHAPMYRRGTFLISDLTGLDANAVTKMAGNTDGATIAASTEFSF